MRLAKFVPSHSQQIHIAQPNRSINQLISIISVPFVTRLAKGVMDLSLPNARLAKVI
jgi:hypothetical protein